MRPKTRVAALSALLALSLPFSGCELARLRPSGVIDPVIVPSREVTGSQVVERVFAFEDQQVTLRVPIDSSVYQGAREAKKSATTIGEVPASVWVPAYHRAFIDEEHQEPYFTSMFQALHQIRTVHGLDDSRYVELVTSMVQGMEYRTDPTNLAPKYPIETFGDGYGDCDDKALLAAALLSRDGYDVAILLFEPEKHIALGIRAPGLDYKGTGYAYVEVTSPSLVGIPPERLSGGLTLQSQPVVTRIGEGTLTYAAGDQIVYIQRRRTEVERAMARLKTEISAEQSALAAERARLNAQRSSLEAISDPQAAQGAIDRYNQQIAAYNQRVEKLDAVVAKHNALVDLSNHVAEHPFARPQVYERLRSAVL